MYPEAVVSNTGSGTGCTLPGWMKGSGWKCRYNNNVMDARDEFISAPLTWLSGASNWSLNDGLGYGYKKLSDQQSPFLSSIRTSIWVLIFLSSLLSNLFIIITLRLRKGLGFLSGPVNRTELNVEIISGAHAGKWRPVGLTRFAGHVILWTG